jgi:N-acetylglucosaminyldiphosphoundecaprenol N-acetyl-beta-D-mannosaminyltransferase
MMPAEPPVYGVLGTRLRSTSYPELTDYCHERSTQGGVVSIDFTNTQIVTMRCLDRDFRDQTSTVDLFIPDGMPLIWCLNRQGAGLKDRVYGPTFMRYCLTHSPASHTHYLLGGSPDCLRQLSEKALGWNKDLRIVGQRHGYFKPQDNHSIVEEINRLSPDFIWVGLGTPKQQAWIHAHKHRIDRGLLMAVGFAFDVNAGTKADAPDWMQRRGLGWLFRLFSEPRRLLTRYAYYNTSFLWLLFKGYLSGRIWSKDIPSQPA